MQAVINRIQQRYLFFFSYLLVLIPGLLLLAVKGKRESFLFLNTLHKPWLDSFFIGYTYMGDGLVAVLFSFFLFFVFKKKKLGLTLLLAYAFTGIVAQIIKPIVESPRPRSYFAPEWLPFFIKDIIHIGNASFPSGHTVTAFAIATVIVLFTNNKRLHILLLLLAVLVGFSRIYLSQHFLLDVLVGSFIGVAGSVLCVYWCRNIKEEKLVFQKSTTR